MKKKQKRRKKGFGGCNAGNEKVREKKKKRMCE